MYIINSSFMVDGKVHEQWFKLMEESFLPYLKQQGVEKMIFSRVLSQSSEIHHTYSLQLFADSISFYTTYTEQMLREYQEIADPLFGVKVVFFNSVMKIIE